MPDLRVGPGCSPRVELPLELAQTLVRRAQRIELEYLIPQTNTFVTDFDEFQKCGDVRMRYLGVATPTSTTVGVTRLAGPDFMVEIEAVAVVNT